MNKLYGTKFLDKKMWELEEIKGDLYHTYCLKNKKTNKEYIFVSIIGFMEVAQNEFLVLKKEYGNFLEITRLKLDNGYKYTLYRHRFIKKVDFIDDDHILFHQYTDNGKVVFGGIYSISKNKELDEARWLVNRKFDIYTNHKENKKKLIFEQKIYGYKVDSSLIFGIDPLTCLPDTPCYSTFRDSYIKINSQEDFKNLENEERRYISFIEDMESNYYYNSIATAKEKIISMKKNSR